MQLATMLIIPKEVLQDMQCAVDFPVFTLPGQFAVASGQGIQRTMGRVQQCINFFRPRDLQAESYAES